MQPYFAESMLNLLFFNLHLNCAYPGSVARFLESRGMIEEALEVATDPDYRFELAIQLGRLEIAKVSSATALMLLKPLMSIA